MIFLSHNHKDKAIVEQIAIKLREIYGQGNVFYDSWSMQPGDGIIDKMNQGLKDCRLFLFFVSKNSLQSNMVKLEWQNAVIKATTDNTKIIPIKIDDCFMPPILMQNLYIDLYNYGFDVAFRQIVDVVSGENTFNESIKEFSNLKSYIHNEDGKVIVECRAEYYLEPISSFLILIKNNEDELSFLCKSNSLCTCGFNKNVTLTNGITCNAQLIATDQGTMPGFPFVVEITPKNDISIELVGVMHEMKKNEWKMIPLS